MHLTKYYVSKEYKKGVIHDPYFQIASVLKIDWNWNRKRDGRETYRLKEMQKEKSITKVWTLFGLWFKQLKRAWQVKEVEHDRFFNNIKLRIIGYFYIWSLYHTFLKTVLMSQRYILKYLLVQ